MSDARLHDDAIAAQIRVPDPEQCPPLTLIVGPCRSGTTALLRAAAAAGHRSYFQPLKQLIRKRLAGETTEFTVAPGREPVILKETFGPFVAEEAAFDPVELLCSRGYPPERLNVIATFRHPVDMYLSTERLVSANDSFTGLETGVFVAAFAQTVAVYERARARGIVTTAFVVDGYPDLEPRDVLRTLFARHGLTYTDDAVDWAANRLDDLIPKDTAPAMFHAPGGLNGVRTSAGYRLERPRHTGSPADTPAGVAGLFAEYERMLTRSALDLGHTK